MPTAVTFTGTISVDGGPPRPFVATGVAEPLSIWGGPIVPPPHPEHPIVIVPPGAIDGEHPAHPIYLPVYPEHPIVLPPDELPPEPGWQWVYTERYGWVLDPKGGGKPRPLP